MVIMPSSAARAGPNRSSSSARSSSTACPACTGSPGLTRQITPAEALTGSSLRARPAPSRQAATPTAYASRRRSQPSRSAATVRVCAAAAWARPGRRPARRPSPGSGPARAVGQRRGQRGLVAGQPGQPEHLARQRHGHRGQVGRALAAQGVHRLRYLDRVARGPARAACPWPGEQRGGAHPGLGAQRRPWCGPAPGPRRALRMNAPLPTLTSSTRPRCPRRSSWT